MGRVFFNTRKHVHALDGAYTVLASDSGKTFMLSATGGTVAITLPTTLEKGLHYKFVTLETLQVMQLQLVLVQQLLIWYTKTREVMLLTQQLVLRYLILLLEQHLHKVI